MITKEDLVHIPEFILYQIKMGRGSLGFKDKELYMKIPSDDKNLPCGCSGFESYKIKDKNGKPCLVKQYENIKFDKYILGTFLQSKEWDSFWNDFYERNPFWTPRMLRN